MGFLTTCPSVIALAFIIVLACIIILILRRGSGRRVAVVVVGDIGRSPRMQYHALSFAESDFLVEFIGYTGSTPHKDILNNGSITLHHMPHFPAFLAATPKICSYILKALWQGVFLFLSLISTPKASHILIQNPPGLPGLAVCWVVSFLRGSKFIIDWHNYGYTILAMAAGDGHPLVRIAHRFERYFGRFSVGNLCVTQAMKRDLRDNWGIEAVTMYDRPPAIFKETPVEDQHQLFRSLAEVHPEFKPEGSGVCQEEETLFTQCVKGQVSPRGRRPALLVSSTSWTEDEDFSILLTALERYESTKAEHQRVDLPDLLCVITGKGPQKEFYQSLIAEKSWNHIRICTPWLAAEDYPKLLGAADLGVSLHASSSGLDLPMKVVDMFGCCLPVCALNFKCVSELVKHGENGLIFKDGEELANQLQECLKDFPDGCESLRKYRQNLRSVQHIRWGAAWKQNVLPLFS